MPCGTWMSKPKYITLLITRPPFVAAILRETEQGVQHHEGYHHLWAEQPQLKSPDLVLPAFSIRIIPLPDRRRSRMLIAQCVAGLLVVPWSKSDDPYENDPWNHRPGLCQPDLAFRLHFVCTNKQQHFRTETKWRWDGGRTNGYLIWDLPGYEYVHTM